MFFGTGLQDYSAGFDGTAQIWTLEAEKEECNCTHVLLCSIAALAAFVFKAEMFEVKGDDFLNVRRGPSRVFDLQIKKRVHFWANSRNRSS